MLNLRLADWPAINAGGTVTWTVSVWPRASVADWGESVSGNTVATLPVTRTSSSRSTPLAAVWVKAMVALVCVAVKLTVLVW